MVKVSGLRQIKPGVFFLELVSPDLCRRVRPGNFLHIKIPSVVLRRPFSVHSLRGGRLQIIFRVKGRGTRALAAIKPGTRLDVLGPLGHGFDYSRRAGAGKKNILVAGGMGIAPLLFLAQRLCRLGASPQLLAGVKSRADLIALDDFKRTGCTVKVASEDGSIGIKGSVVDLLRRSVDDGSPANLYCCGPVAMLQAVYAVVRGRVGIKCQVSFEQFMGCGLGICCGCSIATANGYKKVCKDGPVFDAAEVF